MISLRSPGPGRRGGAGQSSRDPRPVPRSPAVDRSRVSLPDGFRTFCLPCQRGSPGPSRQPHVPLFAGGFCFRFVWAPCARRRWREPVGVGAGAGAGTPDEEPAGNRAPAQPPASWLLPAPRLEALRPCRQTSTRSVLWGDVLSRQRADRRGGRARRARSFQTQPLIPLCSPCVPPHVSLDSVGSAPITMGKAGAKTRLDFSEWPETKETISPWQPSGPLP